jgi:hypothetical protein
MTLKTTTQEIEAGLHRHGIIQRCHYCKKFAQPRDLYRFKDGRENGAWEEVCLDCMFDYLSDEDQTPHIGNIVYFAREHAAYRPENIHHHKWLAWVSICPELAKEHKKQYDLRTR